jgi:RNA polymerase sigma factor (sigma-70 family)
MTAALEDLLRELAPQVLGALVRRYGHFDTAEDAVQEALLVAAQQWPEGGVPENPRAWLITVASRRLTDLLRREQARQRREDRVAQWAPQGEPVADTDDTLVLLFLCCHPSLSAASQIALTLRAVGGLTTAEIARAFLVPEATMTRRITRAKASVQETGARFTLPADRDERLEAVLKVAYLIFNEGYASTTGPSLQRVELAAEGIRLARLLHRLLPDNSEVAGLLALMLLTDARRPARTGPLGELIPMSDQDRTRWLRPLIQEGTALITEALPRGPVGPYQLQAAIAALHAQAGSFEATDWAQIAALYGELSRRMPSPVIAVNQAVAVGLADGPLAGLAVLAPVLASGELHDYGPLHAAHADLLDRAGDPDAAARARVRALASIASPALRDELARRWAGADGGPENNPDPGVDLAPPVT